MANKIQIRRGLKSKLPTLSSGELAYTTDTRETFVGTGSGNVNMGGSHWYMGTAMSGTSTTTGYYSYSACPEVKLGDIYLNTTYGYVYECTTAGSGTTAKWTYKGSIRGATGAKGATGSTGATGATGAAGTRGSVWNSGTAMSGTSTTTGAYSYSGASNALVGDYYLNTTYGYVYRCTTAGSGTTAKWTYQGCIKGATGATGATGPAATVDSDLSYTSTNPVTNREIATVLKNLAPYIAAASGDSQYELCTTTVNQSKYILAPEDTTSLEIYCIGAKDLPSGCVIGRINTTGTDGTRDSIDGSYTAGQAFTDVITGSMYFRDVFVGQSTIYDPWTGPF